MGVNYYLHKRCCHACGHSEPPLHIGKSSSGWAFQLHAMPERGLNSLDDWRKLWGVVCASGQSDPEEGECYIEDDYERWLMPEEMDRIVTERKPAPSEKELRHTEVDGVRCVGRGETWDAISLDFS